MNKLIRKIPTLAELIEHTPEKEKENQLLFLLNQEPPQKWVKTLPNTQVKYVPIERVEFLLTHIFGTWSVKITNTQVIANSVVVTVRLFYTNPLDTEETLFQDGIGAMAMQTNKGAAAADISNLKTNAVMLAAPAAEVEAIKDACHKIGRLFGGSLNRSEQISFEGLLKEEDVETELKSLWEEKKAKLNSDEYPAIERIIFQREKTGYQRALQLLKSK